MSTSGVSSTTSDGLIAQQLINESGGLTSGSTLTNGGAGGTLQLTGLASGINTTELIQAELAQQEEPLDNMEEEISGLNTENTALSTVQTDLQAVIGDALLLGEPSTFFPVQNISSSDSNLVTAATTSGPGAAVGSTSITVTQLASAAQTAFDYTAGTGTGDNTLTVTVTTPAAGGSGTTTTPETLSVADNASAQDIANAINGAGDLGVWATVNSSGQLVMSAQTTGSETSFTASLTDGTGSTAVLGSGTSTAGSNAVVNIINSDGTTTAVQSQSDTATNVIPGVTLTLAGITGTTATANPITITNAAPGPDVTAITAQVQQFVTDYNTALATIEGDVNTTPASESTPSDYSPYTGSLFGDDQLENLASDLRTSLYQDYSGAGISTTMASLQEIGISTGAPTASPTENSVAGELTVNVSQLASALATDPTGVQSLVTAWSQEFQTVANAAAGPAGGISARISGNATLITNMNSQVTSQEALYNQEEASMEEQWAQVESTLESLDNQKTSFTSFSDGLTSSTSSTT